MLKIKYKIQLLTQQANNKVLSASPDFNGHLRSTMIPMMLFCGQKDKTKSVTIISMIMMKTCKLKLTIKIAAIKGRFSIQSLSIRSKIITMLYGEVQKTQRHGASKTFQFKMDR